MDNASLNQSMWLFPYSPANPAIGVGHLLILVVAFVWNLFLMIVMIHKRSICKDPSAVFLFLLALVDFITAVTFIPFNIVTAFANEFIFGPTDEVREGICQTVAFLLAVFIQLSLFILALIAFDRFLIIVYSLNYERIMKPWRALALFGITCIPAILVCIPPFFQFGRYGYSMFVGSCLFSWAGQAPYVATYVVVALIPIVAASVFSLITYIYIRRFFNRQKRQASQWTLNIDKVTETHKARQTSLTRIFLALSATQAFCFLPPTISAFVGVFIGAETLPNAVLILSLLLVMSNAAINPIVQSIFRKEMRQIFDKILKPLKCCRDNKKEFELKNGRSRHTQNTELRSTRNGNVSIGTDNSSNCHDIIESSSPCADTSSNNS